MKISAWGHNSGLRKGEGYLLESDAGGCKGLGRKGKLYEECGTMAKRAFDSDLTSMLLDNPFSNRKTQTRSARLAAPGLIGTIKAFKILLWSSCRIPIPVSRMASTAC